MAADNKIQINHENNHPKYLAAASACCIGYQTKPQKVQPTKTV